jgi:hypothetical protein
MLKMIKFNITMKKLFILLIAYLSSFITYSQSISLDPNSLQLPRLATNPSCTVNDKGKMIFNTTQNKVLFCDGTAWIDPSTGGIPNNWVNSGTNSYQTSGNVGIGTSSPISRLDVLGAGTTSSTNNLTLRNSNGDTLMRVRNDGRIGIGFNANSYGRTLNLGGTGINFYIANETTPSGAIFPTDTSLVLLSNSNANNYLVFQPIWGNTGIGTHRPKAKLHLNGAMLIGGSNQRIAFGSVLSVDGRVTAEDFVTLNSNLWPDYVFEKNYDLMPLAKLEDYITKNKHLPNITAAAEIEKNGIQLGKMTKSLMEKVEEMTLYIIELNKENKKLLERVEKLEKDRS